jgi:hypothetical protein
VGVKISLHLGQRNFFPGAGLAANWSFALQAVQVTVSGIVVFQLGMIFIQANSDECSVNLSNGLARDKDD